MFPVVLGGDHSIAAGTVGGVSTHFHQASKRVGLIWIDAHGDMNTPDSSPSGNVHGMPVSIALEEMALPYEINVFLPCFPENIQPAVDRYTIGRPWH